MEQKEVALWKLREQGPSYVNEGQDADSNLLRQVIKSRSFASKEDLDDFLDPRLSSLKSPFRLKNLKESAERVVKALKAGERIGVYGDYDIDGMSSIALLCSFFKDLDFHNYCYFQPNRFEEGYGLHSFVFEQWQKEGVKLVITVDTGITGVEEVKKARDLGLDVIITDHHQAQEQLPETPWIVNPNQKADDSALDYLCGAGVAFYLVMGIKILLKEEKFFEQNSIPELQLKSYLDFFSLATIADQVDLIGENRILCKKGLEHLLRTQRWGLKALFKECLDLDTVPTARDIAFSVAPKLNAASRMGKAHLAQELLLAETQGTAEHLVFELLALNKERVDVQKKILEEATKQAHLQKEEGAEVLVLHAEDWHEGVLGIVAAKIADQFSCPAIILTRVADDLRGSMRSFSHWSCVELLESVQDKLLKWGGHPAAAGLKLSSDNLESFKKSLQESFLEKFAQRKEHSKEVIEYDGVIKDPVSIASVRELNVMEPWGKGHPQALFMLCKVPVKDCVTLKEKHVKFSLNHDLSLIGFFLRDKITALEEQGFQNIDVLVCPEINRFRNKVRVQLRIEHVRGAQD